MQIKMVGGVRSVWILTTVILTLVLIEVSAFLIGHFHVFAKLVEPNPYLELYRSNDFKFRSFFSSRGGDDREAGPTFEWTTYAMPPIRLPTNWMRADFAKDSLLVNRYRRVKLNDDPNDQETIDSGAYKILISGNSTAVGLGATKNSKTMAAVLQERLRTELGPNARIQVLNYAVPDFKFTDEVISFVMYWSYLKPDIWLVINGDNDTSYYNRKLPVGLKYLVQRKRFSKFLKQSSFYFLPNLQKLLGIFRSSYVQNEIAEDLMNTTEPVFFKKDKELYLQNLGAAIGLSSFNHTKLIHVLQPILWADKHRPTEDEMKMAAGALRNIGYLGDIASLEDVSKKLGPAFIEFYADIRKEIDFLRAHKELPETAQFLNFDDVFEKYQGQSVYNDSKHYNDLGHKIMGERLAASLLPTIRADLARRKSQQ